VDHVAVADGAAEDSGDVGRLRVRGRQRLMRRFEAEADGRAGAAALVLGQDRRRRMAASAFCQGDAPASTSRACAQPMRPGATMPMP